MRPKRKPCLYFSLRSPFSWIALRQLEERVPDAPDLIEYVPYFEPDARTAAELTAAGGDFHYVPMSKAKHLYILSDTKRLAAKHGYPMRWPVDVDPWWDLPHLAWLKARRLGLHREFYAAVTEARWERGENICDPATLREIVTTAGLPVEPLLNATDDEEIRAEAVAGLLKIYDEDIFGVPYFMLGRQRFWGLDRLGDFLDAFLPTVAPAIPVEVDPMADIPQPALAAIGAFDHDTAGGCG
jgi:2-hydroxychromene-2-carboxylate isomerase